MKTLFSKSIALVALMFMSVILSMTGLPFIASAAITFTLSIITPGGASIVSAGLNKEIWLPELMEGFYASDMFISEFRDFSAFVSNNTINLAEAGINPDVLINNTGTIGYASREDTPIAIPLETYDTENTLIKAIETAELSYEKRASILYGHKQALKMSFMQRAAQNIAPASDGTYTPIVLASGTDNGSGLKKLKFSDILEMEKRFDDAEIPEEGRIGVLSVQHRKDLMEEDLTRYNKMMESKMIGSFKLYTLASKRLPRYNYDTGAKVAYEAVPALTDSVASLFFHKAEVMRSQGDPDMFSREKDPELRGDLIGFQMRGVSLPIRNKGIGAIYSPEAA